MRKEIRKILGSERGSGLVIALLTMTIFVILAGTLYQIARFQLNESVYLTRRMQALYIAEAGLQDALHELYLDPGKKVQYDSKPFAGGSYTVSVSTHPAVVIVSTGRSSPIILRGPVSQTIEAVLDTRYRVPPPILPGIPSAPVLVHDDWRPFTWSLRLKKQ